MGTPSPPIAAEKAPEPPALVFDWKSRGAPRVYFRLSVLVAIVGTISAHALCFYMIQLTQARTSRSEATTARIILIDPDEAGFQEFLQQVDDYASSYDSTLTVSGDPLETLEGPIAFVPSFASYDPKLLPVPETGESTATGNDLLQLDSGVVFPPVTAPVSEERAAPTVDRSGKPVVAVRFWGGLENRELIDRPEWSLDQDAAGGSKVVFYLGVLPSGSVAYAFPVDGGAGDAASLIMQDVRRLQFAPVETEGGDSRVQWGMLTLEW